MYSECAYKIGIQHKRMKPKVDFVLNVLLENVTDKDDDLIYILLMKDECKFM